MRQKRLEHLLAAAIALETVARPQGDWSPYEPPDERGARRNRTRGGGRSPDSRCTGGLGVRLRRRGRCERTVLGDVRVRRHVMTNSPNTRARRRGCGFALSMKMPRP